MDLTNGLQLKVSFIKEGLIQNPAFHIRGKLTVDFRDKLCGWHTQYRTQSDGLHTEYAFNITIRPRFIGAWQSKGEGYKPLNGFLFAKLMDLDVQFTDVVRHNNSVLFEESADATGQTYQWSLLGH